MRAFPCPVRKSQLNVLPDYESPVYVAIDINSTKEGNLRQLRTILFEEIDFHLNSILG